MDNFGDLWPRKIWPVGQYIYYVMSGLLGLLLVLGAVALIVRPRI